MDAAGGGPAREAVSGGLKAEAEKSGRPVRVHQNHPNWKWAVSLTTYFACAIDLTYES